MHNINFKEKEFKLQQTGIGLRVSRLQFDRRDCRNCSVEKWKFKASA
jgi:hypothetical protein